MLPSYTFIPGTPCETIYADFFDRKRKHHLVVRNYLSGWSENTYPKAKLSAKMITKLTNINLRSKSLKDGNSRKLINNSTSASRSTTSASRKRSSKTRKEKNIYDLSLNQYYWRDIQVWNGR
ncbi:unnamed protein product [Lepeophtheirus salmonis]|uniref:(salmon louse) hypothetical protein n=1 Tax=Lepeophtheirus salmonis TaxID=72036 RepID=A0A7R8CGY3_LEPSM|nr:unnamed protein product [Lepeophtheirus salmonis]CAF2815793.1 unnamed protein product [Lepeophtheirus salmonis]